MKKLRIRDVKYAAGPCGSKASALWNPHNALHGQFSNHGLLFSVSLNFQLACSLNYYVRGSLKVQKYKLTYIYSG